MARTYGSAAARGYGYMHQQIRACWKPQVDAGLIACHATICLEVLDGRSRFIAPGAPWHLGHTEDRAGWTGPEHQRCGAADGARRGNQQRPRLITAALPGRDITCQDCGKIYHYAAKQCMICGRHYHPSRQVQYTCSRACGVQFKRLRGVQVAAPLPACEICGKPRPKKQQRTCGSEKCLDKLRDGKRMTLTCQRCGKQFAGRSAKYCSQNCQAQAYYYDHRQQVLDKLAAQRRGNASRKTAGIMTGVGTVRHSRTW